MGSFWYERREVPISTEVAVNAIPKGIPPASRIGAQLPEVTGRNIPGFSRRLKRHNGVGRTGLKPIYEESGYVWDERDVHCHVDSGKRVDARCSNSTASHRDDGVDIPWAARRATRTCVTRR